MRLKLTLCRLSMIAVFLLVSNILLAQKTVTGNVTDASGKAVVGATVIVRGSNVGTQTDASGNFSINTTNANSRLVVSSVGFEPADIAVGGKNNVSVSLKSTTSTLNEVVVTGYTSQRKKEITGAVSVVNVGQLKQTTASTGEEALQGRASGINVISSGQPGAASDIRIRGITGFGNNSPLIIVDGVRGDIHNINVNDIESVQILKDASAAIYGIAGSNGVIIVTTKKGKSGKPRVSYDAYYGTTTTGPGYKMANTQQEANAIWQQLKNSGLNPGDPTFLNAQFGQGATPVIPDYIQTYDPRKANPAQPFSLPSGIFGYTLCNCAADSVVDARFYDLNSAQITMANKEGTNWYKEITRNAQTQSHNVSVSAGSEKSSYYFSLGYLDQQGIAKFQFLKRYSVRSNTQFNINDKIRVGENAYLYYKTNPTYSNQGEGSPFSTAFREDAIIPVYDIAGNFAGTKSQGLGNAQNVYANIFRSKDNKNNNWDITGNVFAEVDFLKHFTARTSFGGVVDNYHYYYFNYVAYENAEGNTGQNSFHEGSGYGTTWTYTNTLTYNNTFGQHSVKVLAGTEAVNYHDRSLEAGRSNYFSENPDFWILNTGAPGAQSNTGNAHQSSLWSQFARVDYGYAGKYLINGSVRRDGASVFVGDARYNYFPAASAAWRISEESFLKPVTFINDLKIRYSWGKLGSTTGVLATNPYNLYGSSAGRSFYSVNGSSTSPNAGFYRSNIGNPSTTFEGDIISNIGFDATLLNNKIDLTIDWYKKKISGLLFDASGLQYDIIFTGDALLPKVNIGDMQNTGIDLSASYHGTINRDFKFDVTGTFTSYNNKIVDIPGLPYFNGPTVRNVIIQRNQEGHSVGEFFGYKVLGLFQSDDDVAKSPTQTDAAPGLFKYQDTDGNGKIDANDRTYIGNPNPDFTYGLNISFSYKNFDFSTFFFGSKGNDIFDQTKYYTDFPDFFKGGIREEVALNAWTTTNTNTSIPKLRTTGGFSTDTETNSYFISKGSYLRNKQMQIGYNIPSKALSTVGLERLRIYVQSANLFTITKYKGLDPELQSTSSNNGLNVDGVYTFGIDQGNYPHTPSFLFGVNLNF